VVQSGDSLWDIAQRFGITQQELADANGISNPNQLVEGQELVIPGLPGVTGRLVTRSIAYGDSLLGLSRQFGLPEAELARMNRVASPAQLYAGQNLILPEANLAVPETGRAVLKKGQSLLELAVLQNSSPWKLVLENSLQGKAAALPGDVLHVPGESRAGPAGLPGEIESIRIDPLPLRQGKTSTIQISGAPNLQLSGEALGHVFDFHNLGNAFVALQGTHAMTEPGLYTLKLQGLLPGGGEFAYEQKIYVRAVDYPYDRPLTVNPATIDPAVTRPEDAQWTALAQPVTAQRMWEEPFRIPSPLKQDYCLETGDCWTSRFGNRRSYNGGPYNAFHTGLDIAGTTGVDIFAPAPGVVVFAGPLTVRGNATMIDHGWGVYTGYMHQSEMLVRVGDRVETGQLIGKVGATGRVEGPHLHWEVWVGGVQVDPLEWLRQAYP
jgi:murein DD-endopeptidase MepM/ murein hydrolase activator NlpD